MEIESLIELAMDKKRLKDIKWWLEKTTGIDLCPISRTNFIGDLKRKDCLSLCHKIWPELLPGDDSYVTISSAHCPCVNKKPVKEMFKQIIEISELIERKGVKEKRYQVGDVFEAYNELLIIALFNYTEYGLTGLGCSQTRDIRVTKGEDILLSELIGKSDDEKKYKYLGHFSELIFVGGKASKGVGGTEQKKGAKVYLNGKEFCSYEED
jgi:hypothetical protein